MQTRFEAGQSSVGVVPALQLRYVTRSWCFCSWFLSEYFTPPLLLGSLPEKGNHNKLCCATSPYFPLLSLPLSISLSLFSPTQFHYFNPWLSVSIPVCATTSSLLPGQSGNGSERCMWCNPNRLQFCVRDAAPSAPASCPSSTSTHLHPAVSAQTVGSVSSVLLCLSGSAALVFHFLIQDACAICQLFSGHDLWHH